MSDTKSTESEFDGEEYDAGETMMDDMIRRSDVLNLAKDIVFTDDKGRPVYKHICVNLDHVRSIPAVDAVEVVRCRECVHLEPFRQHDGFCKIDGMLRDNDFFCKVGQRREDGDGDG